MASQASSQNTSTRKSCQGCGAAFARNPKEREKTWLRRRFCSIACRNKANTQFKRLVRDACPHGHSWNAENTAFTAKGGKRCRACDRARYKPRIRRKGLYDPETDTKVCSACRARKLGAAFAKTSNHGNDPYSSYCCNCSRLKYKQWAAANRAKKHAYMQAWYANNITGVREYDAARWAQQEIKARRKAIVAANRDQYNSYAHAARARKRDADGTYTAQDVSRIKTQQLGRCAVCRKRLKTFTVDHIVPLSKGGTNHPKNIQLLCMSCNCRKSDIDPVDFMRRLGRLL